MVRCFLILIASTIGLSTLAQNPAMPDSVRQKLKGMDDTTQIKTLLDYSSALLYHNPNSARDHADWSMALAEKANLPRWTAQSINQRGNAFWASGDYGNALQDYKEQRTLYGELDDSMGIAKADNNLGLVYQEISDYDRALVCFMASLKYFEKTGDRLRLATIYNNIGNIHSRMNHSTLAEEYYTKSVDNFASLRDTNGLCMAYNNLGLVVKESGRSTEALDHFETALDGYEAQHNLYGQAKVISNIATIYIVLERISEAESLNVRAIEISQQLNNPYEISVSQLKMGEFYYKTGRFREALEMGIASLESGEPVGALLPLATANELLALSYEKTGQYDSALAHYKTFKELNDSIFSEKKAKSISELQIRYDTELKDKEIAQIKQQKELDGWRKTALVGVIAALLVIGLLVVWNLRRQVRREKALKEKDRLVHQTQKALAEAEIRTSEVEKARLQEEINYKSKEITNLAMDIVRRNDLMELLDKELKSLRKDPNDQKIKDLSVLVSQNLSLESERQEFQLYVQEAQQSFFHQLEVRFPDLSMKEKRLCAMIRLGLSSKEIGAVFNIATNSVEVARYRIRRKMNLDSGDGLKEFLETL
jgi:tetratricopeptide (TPR) repeat protein